MELALRSIARGILRNNIKIVHLRTIMATRPSMEKATEELAENPFYNKYANKIASLQLTSPEEFLSRVESQQKSKAKKSDVPVKKDFNALLQPKKSCDKPIAGEENKLEKIMKVELLQDKNADEIKEIWLSYHLQKEVLAATIPSGDYDKMVEQIQKTPIFLFPLPRSQGYEFIMSQFLNNTIHFTPLICYQVHKENAPECLTISNYTDFKDKGIVLMRGEFDKTVIDAKEAQCLANQFQLYYNQKDPEKLKLMELFTHKPDEFKHMDLINQIENIKLV